jgi:hypothetical protein
LCDNKESKKVLETLLKHIKDGQFVSWVDSNGMNALHYAILSASAEAVDFIFKRGYFLPPHEPQVSFYCSHLSEKKI